MIRYLSYEQARPIIILLGRTTKQPAPQLGPSVIVSVHDSGLSRPLDSAIDLANTQQFGRERAHVEKSISVRRLSAWGASHGATFAFVDSRHPVCVPNEESCP